MNFILIERKKLQTLLLHFQKKGIPFRWEITNMRFTVFSERGDYMTKEDILPSKEVGFIAQVKNYIVRNKLYEKVPKRFPDEASKSRIKYFQYQHLPAGTKITGGYEVDVKSAYWEELNELGCLSPELYKKGKAVSKKTRLAAAGSQAKVTRVREFDGKTLLRHPPKHSVLTEHIWDEISYQIGNLMQAGMKQLGKDALFFWVDALFVNDKATALKVQRFFQEKGYESEITKVKYIEFQDKNILVKNNPKELNGQLRDAVLRKARKMAIISKATGNRPVDSQDRKYSFIPSKQDYNQVTFLIYKLRAGKRVEPGAHYSTIPQEYSVNLKTGVVIRKNKIRPFPYVGKKKGS